MSKDHIPDATKMVQPLGLASTAGLGPLPEQAGWAVEMRGQCVMFANNAEKASGMSPGAKTRVFTEAQLLAAVAAERERCAKLCEEVSREHFADGMTWECNGAAACANRIRRA